MGLDLRDLLIVAPAFGSGASGIIAPAYSGTAICGAAKAGLHDFLTPVIVGMVKESGHAAIESIGVTGKGAGVDVSGCPCIVAGAHGAVLEEIFGERGVGSERAEGGLEDMAVGVDEAWTKDLAGAVDGLSVIVLGNG